MDAHFCTIRSECPETERCLHNEECAFVPFEGHMSRLEAFERPHQKSGHFLILPYFVFSAFSVFFCLLLYNEKSLEVKKII